MAKKIMDADAGATADPTAFLIEGSFAEFVLMHTNEIKYMCMLGYTFLHGAAIFKTFEKNAPFSYKFISMVMKCTGGGILVPILINGVPVPLSTDSYPIAILVSFLLHTYFPILREVMELSPIFKAGVVFLFETMRAFVVTKLTLAAGSAIPASEFAFPVFGPVFCGALGGCGGAFLPLNKGLDPIKGKGLGPPMFSAFIGALFLHLFLNTSLSDGVVEAQKKGKVIVAIWFIVYGYYKAGLFDFLIPKKAPAKTPAKAEANTKKVKKEN